MGGEREGDGGDVSSSRCAARRHSVDDYFEQRDSGATTTRRWISTSSRCHRTGWRWRTRPRRRLGHARADGGARRVGAARRIGARAAPTANDIVARKLHAMTCYRFSSGPFKRLWIKVGVDPRFNAAHALDQTVTVRLPELVSRGRRRVRQTQRAFHVILAIRSRVSDATHAFRTVPDVRHPVLFLRDVALPSVRAAAELAASSSSPPRATSVSVGSPRAPFARFSAPSSAATRP